MKPVRRVSEDTMKPVSVIDRVTHQARKTARQQGPRFQTRNRWCKICFPTRTSPASGTPSHLPTASWKQRRKKSTPTPSVSLWGWLSSAAHPRWQPPCMVLISSPLSPSDTRCEQRLTKDGRKTPIRQVYDLFQYIPAGFPFGECPDKRWIIKNHRGAVRVGGLAAGCCAFGQRLPFFWQEHFPWITALSLCELIIIIWKQLVLISSRKCVKIRLPCGRVFSSG